MITNEIDVMQKMKPKCICCGLTEDDGICLELLSTPFGINEYWLCGDCYEGIKPCCNNKRRQGG